MARLKLRDYQQEALAVVEKSWEKGISNQLIVLPTGTGKTIIMAAIARQSGSRVLLLAHREELIKQAKKKILLYTPDADIGICKAELFFSAIKRDDIDSILAIMGHGSLLLAQWFLEHFAHNIAYI